MLSEKSELRSGVEEKGKARKVRVISNATSDAILADLMARGDVRVHPDQRSPGGTKYIKAFVTRFGIPFAVDTSSESKQPIWFLHDSKFEAALDRMSIPFDFYPPDKTRNHNLHKLSGFKNGALLRAYPETKGDAMRIVDMLSRG
jgi:hypothetical protein